MDLISEYVFVLKKAQPKTIDTFLPRKSKLRRLYDAVAKGKVTTDLGAAKLIYHSTPDDKKYLMLKRSLISKLSELVRTLPGFDDEDTYLQVRIDCKNDLILAEKLLLENVYHNAEKLLKRIIKRAQEFYLYDILFECAKNMRTLYYLKGFYNETEFYNNQIKLYNKQSSLINLAEGMWQIMESREKFIISKRKESIQFVTKSLQEIKTWNNGPISPFLNMYTLKLHYKHNYLSSDFLQCKNVLEDLTVLYESYPFLKTNQNIRQLLYDNAHTGKSSCNLTEADKFLNNCLQLTDYRAFDKFEVQALHFDILLKMGRYMDAVSVLNEVKTTHQFQYLNSADMEAWKIKLAYLSLLYLLKEQPEELSLNDGPQNFSDLMELKNQCKIVQNDKTGYNIQLIVLWAISKLITEQEHANLNNSLKVYYHRYLKDLEDSRTQNFFKFLIKVSSDIHNTENFKNEWEELSETFKTINKFYHDCELVPYEKLASLVINKLV